MMRRGLWYLRTVAEAAGSVHEIILWLKYCGYMVPEFSNGPAYSDRGGIKLRISRMHGSGRVCLKEALDVPADFGPR